MHFSTFLTGTLAAALVSAHPGHDLAAELAERKEALSQFSRKDLSHCAEKIKARGLEARAVARRNALAAQIRKRGNLKSRDLASLLNTTHHSSNGYTLQTPESTLFASNSSCILSPEVTEGPYYVAGEYVRENVIEKEPGVELTLDLQVLDIETCEPVKAAYLEIWHCNSTGVYSGVDQAGNGDGNKANLNATFLRGIQQTDAEGVAQFETLFPGHYTGRATHIHVMVHQHATPQANGTLLSLTAAHVGQVYFDQDLITRVEAQPEYVANKQPLTTNAQDFLLAEGAETSDPFVQYVLLGDKIEDGLLGWIAFGVNTTVQREVRPGATFYATGGEMNASPGGPGGPGGPPGGPGGPIPSGFPALP
ncbi:Intradiol ring-cleavage dioxygenase [Lasiosphaeria hispida]|uniref:Intradiol ring-cleavage dioxygenase n=1 Tax=Lasiosphaeria hispida TaxID=260671 RepID=A0AAJ0MCS1_9PEZI|nr:Intradiol ring-cleavage dioxygenase [Lasiosphaeria hispida]